MDFLLPVDLLLSFILLETPQESQLRVDLCLRLLELNTRRYVLLRATVRARRVRTVGIGALTRTKVLLAIARRSILTRRRAVLVRAAASSAARARATIRPIRTTRRVLMTVLVLEALALVRRLRNHGVVDAMPVLEHVQVFLTDAHRLVVVDLHQELVRDLIARW